MNTAQYQVIANTLGISFDGIHMSILVQFTILEGPAKGATFFLRVTDTIDEESVRNRVREKEEEFSLVE